MPPLRDNRDWVFGLLALQEKILDHGTLATAIGICAVDPSRTLAEVLSTRGALTVANRDRLEALVDAHLRQHDGDPERSLADLDASATLRHELEQLTVGGRGAPAGGGRADPPATLGDLQTQADPEPESPGFGSLATQADPLATVAPTAPGAAPPSEFGSLATQADPYATVAPTAPGAPSPSAFGSLATEADPYATAAEGRPAAFAGAPSAAPEVDPYATSATGMRADATSAEGVAPGPPPSWVPAQQRPASPYAPERFHVLRHLARGGLGAVYVARDQEIGRDVALKEIQDRHADNPISRSRFLLEAEVTGGLEHPGIVPVYSLGQYPDGRPYYAMRFIRGDSLKKAIEEFHKAEGPGRDPGQREVEFRGLLRRFLDVCNALEYAHCRGVIHRDIKPDNIMLGPFGETLVVDWGLAKPLDRPDPVDETAEAPLRPPSASGSSSATQVGSAIGTPAFMSPEQARGQVDQMGPAADIYSLGATLYALLAGRPPFGERDLYALLEKVKRGEFAPPRQFKADVPPALEAICLKAMAPRAEDRYGSARALAEELEHWLADEPVSVYREPWRIRFARWRRRHRAAVSAAAALLITGVLALSIGSVLVWREQQRTLVQFRRAEANFRRAEANFQAALDAVDQMLTQVGDEDLADVPHLEAVRRSLLERARDFYQDFLLKQKVSDPGVRRETGRAHSRVGDIQEMLGQTAAAERSYRRALEMQRELVGEQPGSDAFRKDLALSENNLGILLKKLNRFEDSESSFRDALALRTELVKESPSDPDRRRDLAASQYFLGALLANLRGRREDATRAYDQALTQQQALVAEAPGQPADRRELARYLNNQGVLLKGAGRRDDAEKAFGEAISIQKDLAAQSPRVPGYRRRLAQTQNNLGTLFERAEPKKAEAAYRESVRLGRELALDFPSVPDYQQELGGYLNNLGRLLTLIKQTDEAKDAFAEAEAALRRALKIREQLVQEFPQRPDYQQKLALVCVNLGSFIRSKGQPAEADPLFDRARTILKSLVDRYPDVPEYQRDLGRVLATSSVTKLDLNDLETARARLVGALPLLETARAACPQDRTYVEPLRDAHFYLADLLLRSGKHEEAAGQVEDLVRLSPEDAMEYVTAAALLMRCVAAATGDSALAEARKQEAIASYTRRAVDLLRQAVQAGFARPELLKSPTFGPLHGDAAFQELLKELEEKTRPVTG